MPHGGAARALPVLTEQKPFARNRLPERDTTCKGCVRRSGAGSSGTREFFCVAL
jgi:hypothetical protein